MEDRGEFCKIATNDMSKSKLRAVIFDLDDTLFHTTEAWREARLAFLRELGIEPLGSGTLESAGHSARTTARILALRFAVTKRQGPWERIFVTALHEAVRTTPPALMPGARQILLELQGRCLLGLASGSPAVVIQTLLTQAGMSATFDCVLSSESFPQCKPAPDVFLGVADHLKVAPSACLVIEDSLVGVQAARAAGMTCFAIPSQTAQLHAMESMGARPFGDLREAAAVLVRELASA